MLAAIVFAGAGALEIVQGQNPPGIFLIFLGIISTGFVGNAVGRKSGIIKYFKDLPEDEEYVFHDRVKLNLSLEGGKLFSTEVAIIRKPGHKDNVKLTAVQGFYHSELKSGDFFMKKGDRIFIRK